MHSPSSSKEEREERAYRIWSVVAGGVGAGEGFSSFCSDGNGRGESEAGLHYML